MGCSAGGGLPRVSQVREPATPVAHGRSTPSTPASSDTPATRMNGSGTIFAAVCPVSIIRSRLCVDFSTPDNVKIAASSPCPIHNVMFMPGGRDDHPMRDDAR
ncbi:hypothetical protein H4W32_009019 [Actinophytocola algeriensis]|uniref:Uncharacterized protein n=1 Tax=Actinophytocola algeriensis TaxID=1768010 RepID=A0A7W7VJU9_9PSEU|nr:hypothetical protein [Actinophytocola algeriensis]MBE1480977.1 hypothetical protein [Actinophytocola algeriensis]